MSNVDSSAGGFPGLISQFDTSAFSTGAAASDLATGARYGQLGLGQTGSTPTTPGNFGGGSTAMRMDLGLAPSLTGGIPSEFAAGAGEVQTQDLSTTLSQALNNLQTSAGNKGTLLTNAGNLFGSK